jgi:hypothetical protein
MNVMKYVFNFSIVESRTIMPAFPISISGQKNVYVGKKHNKYCIFLNKLLKITASRDFFRYELFG